MAGGIFILFFKIAPAQQREVKIEVIHNFYDKENNLKLRKVGDKYSVSKERGKYLIELKVAKEIPEQKGGDSESPAEA